MTEQPLQFPAQALYRIQPGGCNYMGGEDSPVPTEEFGTDGESVIIQGLSPVKGMGPTLGRLCANQWFHTSEYKAAQIGLDVLKKEKQQYRKLRVLSKIEIYFLLSC